MRTRTQSRRGICGRGASSYYLRCALPPQQRGRYNACKPPAMERIMSTHPVVRLARRRRMRGLVSAPPRRPCRRQRTQQGSRTSGPRSRCGRNRRVGIAPARVVFTAELVGGADDFEEYYCPTIEWEWGDGTTSESNVDCAPYEAGKSAIRRRYTSRARLHGVRAPTRFRPVEARDRQLATATRST